MTGEDSIEPIQLHSNRPVAEIVHALDNLLARARRGEIRALAYCADTIGHETLTSVLGETENTNIADQVYNLEKLKMELMLSCREQAISQLGLDEDPE